MISHKQEIKKYSQHIFKVFTNAASSGLSSGDQKIGEDTGQVIAEHKDYSNRSEICLSACEKRNLDLRRSHPSIYKPMGRLTTPVQKK